MSFCCKKIGILAILKHLEIVLLNFIKKLFGYPMSLKLDYGELPVNAIHNVEVLCNWVR